MAENKQVEKFRKVVEKAFSTKSEKLKLNDLRNKEYSSLFSAEYNTALKIVANTKTSSVLKQLMKAYLELYGQYINNTANVQFYMSDQLFQHLIEQSARVKNEDGDLFELWDGFLVSNKNTDDFNSFIKRYNSLSKTVQSNIQAFRAREREKRRKSKSILDALKNEYARQKGVPPQSNDNLYEFDPVTSGLKPSFEFHLEKIKKAWNTSKGIYTKENMDDLNNLLEAFTKFLAKKGKENVLSIFQIIKYLQDLVRLKIEVKTNRQTGVTETHIPPPNPSEAVLFHGLYGYACVQLALIAQVNKLYDRNRFGFTNEEVSYFIKPVIDNKFGYVSNIRAVLDDRLKNAGVIFEKLRVFLNTYILTQNQLTRATLVPLDKTLEIQDKWEKINDVTALIRLASRNNDTKRLEEIFENPKNAKGIEYLKEIGTTGIKTNVSGAELGKTTLHAGATAGTHSKYGDITIVYIDPQNTDQIYIEYSTLRPQVFSVRKAYIDDKFYGAMIYEIYRNTIGIVYVTEIILLAIGFLPVLVEAGFAALIYEVAIFYASQKIEEQASKINPTFGKVLGVLLNAFTPRPNFKPEVKGLATVEKVDNTGLSNVLNTTVKDKNPGLSKILNAPVKDKTFLDRATALDNKALSKLDTEVNNIIARITVHDDIMQMNSGLPLRIKDIKTYMEKVKTAGKFPTEWKVALSQSEPLRKMIADAEKVSLVRITAKQMKAPPYKFQRSSMGSEYELHLTINGKDVKLDGVIIGSNGKSWIGESKFTYLDDLDNFVGEGVTNASYHYKFLDEKVLPQFSKYSKLAKKYGFEGVSVQTNTEYLWATFEQVTRYRKNVEIILTEFNWKTPIKATATKSKATNKAKK